MEGFAIFILTIVMLSCVALFGILLLTWKGILNEARDAAEEKMVLNKSQLVDIKALNDPSFEIEDLINYYVAYSVLQSMLADGRINLNAANLHFSAHAAVNSWAYGILYKRHRAFCIVCALIFLPSPVGWLALAVGGAIMVIFSLQAGKFQVMVRDALRADKTTATAAEGCAASQIGKLHDLMKSGALTKDEFEAEKKKILKKAA